MIEDASMRRSLDADLPIEAVYTSTRLFISLDQPRVISVVGIRGAVRREYHLKVTGNGKLVLL